MLRDIAPILLWTFGFVAVVFAAAFWLSGVSCAATGRQMGLKSQYHIMTDCMVMVRNEWVPLESFRTLKETK